MKVFLTGGSGYVGQPLVRSLLAHGHTVAALSRPHTHRTLPTHPNLTVVEGDLYDHDTLANTMRGSDAVIHLVGIIRERKSAGVTMTRVHVEGTQTVVHAAQKAGVTRFLHMSALGAREGAVSAYHRSKWEAEQLVRQSGIAYTIFRPSVIFGMGGPGPNFVAQLRDLVLRSPVCPVIGDGRFYLQPVAVQTVVDVFRMALDEPAAAGRTYEVGGPDVVSYVDILRRIAVAEGKRLVCVHVPLGWMERLVKPLQRFPFFPLTMDQLTMLKEGNTCSDSTTLYHDFAVSPIPFHV